MKLTAWRLKNERLLRRLSVRKAAPILGISWQYLTQLENGKRTINDDRAELIMLRYHEYDDAETRERERRREAEAV